MTLYNNKDIAILRSGVLGQQKTDKKLNYISKDTGLGKSLFILLELILFQLSAMLFR